MKLEEKIEDKDKNEQLIHNNEQTESRNESNNFKYILSYFFYIAVIMILIVLLIVVITICTDKRLLHKEIYSRSDKKIIKPSSDFRKYRHLILKNGLEAIVISDPVTTTASASLSVKAGANNDPKNLYGLAHFTEHMLFLGSKNFPNGDEYFKTITENSGNFNAYTDREITNYFFDIHYSAFDKAIDIFSRFFIDPLFHKDKVDKEVNAVNSEYERNLIMDSKKRSQIFAFLAKSENPFHRFTTGNLETLVKGAADHGLDLREELIKFHNKHYVAEKMKLVLYSNMDVDELEEMVANKFSEIKPSEDFDILTSRLKKNNDHFSRKSKNKSNEKSNSNNSTNNMKKTHNFANNHKMNASKFVNPFDHDILGSLIKFDSISMEYEMEINFIQPPSFKNLGYFNSNPYYFFYNIFTSKEIDSLYDILKKKELITKLSVEGDRQFDEWSEFSLSISLTKKGAANLDNVLQIINHYIELVKADFINKSTHSYIQKLSKLNFEYRTPYTHKTYFAIADIAKRSQSFPIQHVLDDSHFINTFHGSADYLSEFAENLDLEKSLIFIPSKSMDESFKNYLIKDGSSNSENNSNDKKNLTPFILPNSEKEVFESIYKTNYKIYKINWEKIKNANITLPLTTQNENLISIVKSIDENLLNELISQYYSCNINCVDRLQTISNSEPLLISKTNTSQLWFKHETTLNFKETSVNILFNFEKYNSKDEKINLILLKNWINRKLRIIKQKLKFLSKTLQIKENKRGIEVVYTSFDENLNKITKELSEELKFIAAFDNWIEDSDFEFIKHDTHDELLKEFNSQPHQLAYEYAKKSILTNYTTSEEYLNYLNDVTIESFIEFVERFSNEYKTKILIVGDISKEKAKEVYQDLNPILKSYSTVPQKIPTIREKKKMRIPTIKNTDGNYLLRMVYHEKTNKNNVLLKCYKIGKNNYKNEVMVNLFNGILGNIIFQELRAKRQFGYVAKSRVEMFDNYYFFCIHVQGSYQLPNVIDDAALELVDTLIKEKIEKLDEAEIKEAKRRNLDTITSSRLILSSVSERYFNSIVENNFDFPTFKKMEKFSASVQKDTLLNFYEENFKSQNIVITVYMYSQNVSKENQNLKGKLGQYQEITPIELKKPIKIKLQDPAGNNSANRKIKK